MVQAELRAPYSADVTCDDLEQFVPEDPTSFGIPITAGIGPKGGKGVEVFDFFVCTPRWLEANMPERGYAWGRNKLILPTWSYDALLAALRDLCSAAKGPVWDVVATRLARYGAWEFEDVGLTPFRP